MYQNKTSTLNHFGARGNMTQCYFCLAPLQVLLRGKDRASEFEPRGLNVFVVFQRVDPEWNLTSPCRSALCDGGGLRRAVAQE